VSVVTRKRISYLTLRVIDDMAPIGKPIRKIEVQPLQEPDPTYVPQENPVPEPVREPVTNVQPALP